MFSLALFTVTKQWEQPKCPSMDEQVFLKVHIYNAIVPLKTILSFATTLIQLEDITLRQISQAFKDKYHMISYVQPTQLSQRRQYGGQQRLGVVLAFRVDGEKNLSYIGRIRQGRDSPCSMPTTVNDVLYPWEMLRQYKMSSPQTGPV